MMRNFKNRILIRKMLLNILLKYLSPTNSLIVYISQDLDKLIALSQKNLYLKYLKRIKRIKRNREISFNYKKSINLRNIA